MAWESKYSSDYSGWYEKAYENPSQRRCHAWSFDYRKTQKIWVCQSNKEDLVSLVTIPEKKTYGKGPKKVIALDCGMKEAQMKYLLEFPIQVERVPYDYNFLEEDYDGLLFLMDQVTQPPIKSPLSILNRQ